jgi:hypothetical protein
LFETSADLREVLVSLAALEPASNLADALVETRREISVAFPAELFPTFLPVATVVELRGFSVL